ncbi:MAG: dihydrofolate reductase [Bacilli bacterium]|nr:dihydrofolate reductase [Bacilli bacterium]
MNNLTIIAAIGKNNELGYKNGLIWRLKEDMKFFKENTIGKPIVMGRKTLESLPKLLPNRTHIVLTHQDIVIPGVIIIHSKEELFNLIKDEEVMIIGGESIYKMFIDDVDKMLLTEIDKEYKDADAYFPEFNKDNWNIKVLSRKVENNISYNHIEYTKK